MASPLRAGVWDDIKSDARELKKEVQEGVKDAGQSLKQIGKAIKEDARESADKAKKDVKNLKDRTALTQAAPCMADLRFPAVVFHGGIPHIRWQSRVWARLYPGFRAH